MRTVTSGALYDRRDLQARPFVVGIRQPQPTIENFGWPVDVADELQARLQQAVIATPQWRRGHVAFVVTADGVDVVTRAAQADQWRAHGLDALADRLRQIARERLAVVLLGDDVGVLSVSPAFAEATL